MTDPSNGWEAIADRFADLRSDIGADIVRRWSIRLPPGGTVVDIGCGTGVPIARTLVDAGFVVAGIDPSPSLLAAFRRSLPHASAACETAEDSGYFGQRFDGAVAIGLLFLLPAATQQAVIARVAAALRPEGNFLFSAPRAACSWHDTLTGRKSQSLGEEAYRTLLARHGLRLAAGITDTGGNHYFTATADHAGQA